MMLVEPSSTLFFDHTDQYIAVPRTMIPASGWLRPNNSPQSIESQFSIVSAHPFRQKNGAPRGAISVFKMKYDFPQRQNHSQ